MKTPLNRLVPSVVVLSLALAAAGGDGARADPRRDPQNDYPGAAPGPSGSASALPPLEPEPEAIDGGKPWVPALGVAFPEGTSDAPSKEEWASAAAATEARVTDPGCKAQRVRAWYRVTCHFAQRIELISGVRDGLSFGCTGKSSPDDFCQEGSVTFQARRGDKRAVVVFTWSKYGPEPDAIVTEQFLDGDPLPLVTVTGLHWGF